MIETDITKMFGIKHPIFGAPMGPFYTTELTVAVSEAGGLGVLSHVNLVDRNSLKEMEKAMLYVVEHTDKPFGFNIRTSRMQPDADELVRQVPKIIMKHQKVKEQCVYALTSAGSASMLPKSKNYQKLKEEGGSQIKHFHVAPTTTLMQKSLDAGADGLVITGTEGGGHQSYEKVSTLVLLQEAQEKFPNVPKIACGGFTSGQSLAAALMLGAGAIAMGSRFIASEESEFHQNYKNIVPPAKSDDTELVTGFFGPIRLWKNTYCKNHGLVSSKAEKMAQEATMSFDEILEDQKHYEMVYNGDIDNGAVLLGQSIGCIDKIEKVSDIINNIMKDAENLLKNAPSYLK
jgi:NAD(P)H-dependent flavin oxidoreductase YrpB (nitropropane dioxygenase family)